MKNTIWIVLLFPFWALAQNEVNIQFHIKNAKSSSILIFNNDFTNPDVLFGNTTTQVPLIDGKTNWKHQISNPIFITARYRDSITRKYFSYIFFLSPKDDLDFSFDANSPETTVVVKGKGARNNQPLIQKLINDEPSFESHKKDSLPDDVLKAINVRNIANQKTLKDYISENRPTKEFIDIHSLYVKYFPLWTYIDFKGDQKFNIKEPFIRNEHKWQAIEDSLININSVNNQEILVIPDYVYFLPLYLSRIKERLWEHHELLKEYYHTDTHEEATEMLKEDPDNLLKEKIIEKHFTGKTAEFLYAILFKRAINEKENNLPEIFSRFTEKYPHSPYIPHIEPFIKTILKKRERTLTDEMVLLENPKSYQTFDDILTLMKDKTVLVDMWGTWCGPCRSELSLHSEAIKNHFKDKPLHYLYIANHDIPNEDKWKELIPYYNLTGTHILASSELTRDIMAKVKGQGYPTYIIIKKDGTFELSEAGYPMNREVLINQLEDAMND
ncbi:MAG: TlpA family protein disulfide reductase [Bacteroidetes bacterium]|nr:TlpA family protein disulfide reductase [Bacteroidota bacterium]